MNTLSEIDRVAPTQRPAGRAIGFQTWTDLLFVHWRVPAAMIAPLVPAELSVDLWDGDAWVGLVPFRMSGVRPWWSPSLPGISSFPETNVRTYVHLRGRDPGVWFFSLDAASWLAVMVARRRWNLNYFRSSMQVRRTGQQVHYASRRLWPGPRGAGVQIEAQVGGLLPSTGASGGQTEGRALPGSLEHFLVERYILYARNRSGGLRTGRVHHEPYPLHEARLVHCDESLLSASGIQVLNPPCHVAYSPGVAVEIFPLSPSTPALP